MKTYLIIIFLILTRLSYCQNQEKIFNTTCECLEALVDSKKSKIDLQLAYESCYNMHYEALMLLGTGERAEVASKEFLKDLEARCDAYSKALAVQREMFNVKSDSRIKNTRACEIMRSGDFEDVRGLNGIIMSMKDTLQTMTFGDAVLYTKSKVVWMDDCTYKLIFMESTNPYENSVLKKGDERIVRILDIKKDLITYETEIFGGYFIGRLRKIR